MTQDTAAAVALVATGYTPLLASLTSVPLSPLKALTETATPIALVHPRLCRGRRVMMKVGREGEGEVEGAFSPAAAFSPARLLALMPLDLIS